jgi:CMP-N-acetylneuraminic acid synthetase
MVKKNANIVALLPMKGNSERIYGKNLKDFNGQPLFQSVLKSLIESKYISKIVVNTDSKTISEMVLDFFGKAFIHWRSEGVLGDSVSMNKVIEDDLKRLEESHFFQTHSTNPLLTAETIDKAIELYFSCLENHDSLFSVNRLQTRLFWENGGPVNHDPNELLRTQDLQPIYEENSNIYIFSKESFYGNGKNRMGAKPKMFEMDKLESIDIDEKEDWLLAEALSKIR